MDMQEKYRQQLDISYSYHLAKRMEKPGNPDKVVRADSRAEYGNERGVQRGLSYESNFGNFVRTLANIPRASEIMSKMLFSGMRNVIEAGIGTGMAEEIHMLLGLWVMGTRN